MWNGPYDWTAQPQKLGAKVFWIYCFKDILMPCDLDAGLKCGFLKCVISRCAYILWICVGSKEIGFEVVVEKKIGLKFGMMPSGLHSVVNIYQGSFWVWAQPMRDDVTSSLIGWAHTQNDPCIPFFVGLSIGGSYYGMALFVCCLIICPSCLLTHWPLGDFNKMFEK